MKNNAYECDEGIFLQTAKPIEAFQSIEILSGWLNWILQGKIAII